LILTRNKYIPALLLTLVLALAPSVASADTYSENFVSLLYRDTGNTTASWMGGWHGDLKLGPYRVTQLGSVPVTQTQIAGEVARIGGYAYAATGTDFSVFGLSDVSSPALLGTYTGGTWFHGVFVDYPYAYVADHTNGLKIIDVSDASNPTLIGSYNTPGTCYDVDVQGDVAYVADSQSMLVLDVGNVTSPSLLATFVPSFSGVTGVDVVGDRAYVVNPQGIVVVDVVVPLQPWQRGGMRFSGWPNSIQVAGEYAYCAGDDWVVVDVSDAANLRVVERHDDRGGSRTDGDFAYLGSYSALHVLDVTYPANLLDSFPISGSFNDLDIAGDQATALAATPATLRTYRIAERISPPFDVAQLNVAGGATCLDVFGNLLAVGGGSAGLSLVRITVPWSPSQMSVLPLPGEVLDLSIEGRLIVMASGSAGLRIVSVEDPYAPVALGGIDTPGSANSLSVDGDWAYLADGGSGVQVVKILSSSHLTLRGSLATSGDATGVDVSGDLLVVSDGGGLTIADVTVPPSPTAVGSWASPGGASDVALMADLALVADGDAGLEIIDIADPTLPSLVGSVATPGSARRVFARGDYAYVSCDSAGVVIVDITDPGNPVIIGTHATAGLAMDAVVDGDHMFVADGSGGLSITQVFLRRYHPNRNVAQSLTVNPPGETVFGARLSATQDGQIDWELSANGGVDWQSFQEGGALSPFAVVGDDLRWRATLAFDVPNATPECEQLDVEWVVETPLITSITDVWWDQGGWVTLDFNAAGYDCAGVDSIQIDSYLIYRRVPSGSSSGAGSEATPGGWEVVDSIPASGACGYSRDVPTIADAACGQTTFTEYYVAAATLSFGTSFDSPPDSGYSVDNRAPDVSNLIAEYNSTGGHRLTWDRPPDGDLDYFNVYRMTYNPYSHHGCPSPSEGDLIASTTDTVWVDADYGDEAPCYRVAAVDTSCNVGYAEAPTVVTAADKRETPTSFALHQNVPNPFNPTTTLSYAVPAGGGDVTLQIYDVAGRVVRTLVDGFEGEGEKRTVWNGRDDRGRPVASGVYFYRLTAPGFSKARKMVLLR